MQNVYTYTVPLFIKMLGGLKNVLSKSEAFAKEKGMTEEEFLNNALAPDMFPFVRQIQIASDNAKGACARLSGMEPPKFEDNEKSFAELVQRIDKTLAFVSTFTPESFTDAPTRKITLPYFPDKYMMGDEYALEYVVPNFLFHVSIAYAIARKVGVPIGKADYMNGLPFKDL